MEQRRLYLFFAVSMTVWLAWFYFIGPMVVPEAFKAPPKKPRPIAVEPDTSKASSSTETADAIHPANVAPEVKIKNEAKPVAAIPMHPDLKLQLGPADMGREQQENPTNFCLAANLTSRGAAIDFVELTEKDQYPAFGHRGQRVKVVGSDFDPLKTFALKCPEIDSLLDGLSLAQIPWEVVPEADAALTERAATFRIVSPDNRWQITKHFEIKELSPAEFQRHKIEKNDVSAYEVKLKITVKNLTDRTQKLAYTLQGPVGIPLEDAENSPKNRDLRMGFLRDDGKIDESKLSASETVKKSKSNNVEISRRKLKYIGVDVLYFAALVLPGAADQVEATNAVLAKEHISRPEFSDVSFEMTSIPLEVSGNSEVSHDYTLFAGPKRKEMISLIPAIAVMDYGWFDSICRGMVWLLNMFHGLGLSYGVAIICLTVLVRTLLLPISKHQAANAAKMKVLQPKIMAKQKELEAKYGKNTEEYMKAAQELSKEQLSLMMSGCLPVFLQLPIFIALYRAIGSSIELRMVPFLWFENLASPDALFKLPFVVPWFGWTDFNLLPCISAGLMFIHQKLTMPPPTNEEMAQQQKMMNFMMIFMGAMFFRVPSGLCLYFIATNIWSMTERWLFEHLKKQPPGDELASTATASPQTSGSGGKPTSPQKAEPEKPSALGGIWNRLQEVADTERAATRQLDNSNSNRNDKKKKKR